MNLPQDQTVVSKRYNNIEGLEGFEFAVNQFLGVTKPHTREKFALPMMQHEHPVARYIGASALLDTAFQADRSPVKKRMRLYERGIDGLIEAHQELTARDIFPSFKAQSGVDLADAQLRQLIHISRQTPNAHELAQVQNTVEDEFFFLNQRLQALDEESADFSSSIGVAAELGVRSLLDRYTAYEAQGRGEERPTHFTLGSLMSEDLITGKKWNDGKKGNWDLTVFGTDNMLPERKIQVKYGNFFATYASWISRVSFKKIGKNISLEGLRIDTYAELLRTINEGDEAREKELMLYSGSLWARLYADEVAKVAK